MIREFKGNIPEVGKRTYIAETAEVIGKVKIGEDCSIWPGVVLRGDMNTISIGDRSNVQDNSTLHNGPDNPLFVGSDVTIGHNCVVHGCTIEGPAIIGMGAIILNGAKIGRNCMIGAGAVVTEGKIIPDNTLVVGIPGKVIRELTDKDTERVRLNAHHYVVLKEDYL